MRKTIVVFSGCLALTACGDGRFEGDVRFKVTEADSLGYELVLAQEQPVDMVSDWYSGRVNVNDFVEPVSVGDEVICHIVQQRVQEKGIATRRTASNCKKA
ncbi:hypothetical protein SAMN04488074_112211 [Lentzea albidocapillata subsp. violacea]|uniref:Lipoprotein n=1 Tax=Lentzea albidocapillata subsp. violacea TaxID=128104 RepID=A0A1G9LX26_9PSEU|nr:hypothetical protein [Lentzea albidocapillata]SDL66486.1 hypothetical protein SAMN04488074_112211 [Lentzea albidocapillata subsp. violacea]